MTLSQNILASLIDYNPETGEMIWKRRSPTMFGDDAARCAGWNTRYAGQPALRGLDSEGYRHGSIMGHNIKAHRAAWIITHGYEPKALDHINHNKADNRLSNLREVCARENQRNCSIRRDNSSGATGVSLDKGRWRARINLNGKECLIGYFATFAEAVSARKRAEVEHGFHENHGKKLIEQTRQGLAQLEEA